MFISKSKYDKKGVTLVEILIAFIILTLAAFGAASLISHGHKLTRHDFRRDEAIQLLVDRMNRLSTLPFSKFKQELGSSTTELIKNNGNIASITFGEIHIGNNKYDVVAKIKPKDITFENLMELSFPNPNYIATAPYTWNFRDRSNISYTGSNYQIVKVCVEVTPKSPTNSNEKTYEAVTYICNMEH